MDLPPLVTGPDFSMMRGATEESNWMVPSLVMTGHRPESLGDVQRILAAGINTFVCLLEDPPEYLREVERCASDLGLASLHWIHFPIDDMSVTSDADTVAFVQELAALVQHGGRRVYIHCWSGRGRTGTVAIPLLLALYPDLSNEQAKDLVNEYKRNGRTGYTRGGHMPEVKSQHKQISANEQKYKRGGHSAKNN